MGFDWKDIYQDLLDIKLKRGSEQEYQDRIYALFKYYLRWQSHIVAEECIHIGATNTIRPDFVLYQEDIPQVVIECKEPNHYQTERNKEQLFSYMRQKKVDFGLYIGEIIQLYYDVPSDAEPPLEIFTLQIDKEDKYGSDFVKLFNASDFNQDRLKEFCRKRLQEKEKEQQIDFEINRLVSDEGRNLIKALLLSHYAPKAFTQEEAEVILDNVEIIVHHKGVACQVSEPISCENGAEPTYRNEKKTSRGRQYYSINGKGKYNKGGCALEVVKLYVLSHPSATWNQLDSTFNTWVYNYITLKEEVEEREEKSNDRSKTKRWFKDDPLQSSDGKTFYVTTQVGTGCPTNFEEIVKLAGELNYRIEKL